MILDQRPKSVIVAVGAVMLFTAIIAGVGVITLHRQALGALPGQTIVARFPAGLSMADALSVISNAGAALASIGPNGQSYRVHVIDPEAPNRLAKIAWIYRDPLESLAHCFGLEPEPTHQLRHN